MSKTPSNKLFKLIKSLSGSEKRYFKLFAANKQGENSTKYIQLFDAIDLQETFDEAHLKKTIYENQPINSQKYSELKAYLYDLILKSLQGYDEKNSIDFRLKHMLLCIRVLYKRSHYAESLKILNRAKTLAYKYEDFICVVELLAWEKQIAYTQENIEFLENELDHIDNEEKNCLEQLRNLSTYRNLLYQLIISRRKDAVLRSELKIDKLKSIMQHPLLENIQKAKSHKAQILFHRVFSNYNYSVLDYEKFYLSSKQLLELMESKSYLMQEDISGYIFALTNLSLSCGLLEKHEELKENLEKFHHIKAKTIDDEFRIFKHYNTLKFRLCITTGEFEEGHRALTQHLKDIQRFGAHADERGAFYFQYFYIYFGMGDYEKALVYLNQWLNLPRSVEREDLQSLARILNLIIHYEMDNTILLEYLSRSTYRFLKKAKSCI